MKRKYGKYKLVHELPVIQGAPVSTQRADLEQWLKDDANVESLIDQGISQIYIIRDDVTMKLGRKQVVTREEVEDEV